SVVVNVRVIGLWMNGGRLLVAQTRFGVVVIVPAETSAESKAEIEVFVGNRVGEPHIIIGRSFFVGLLFRFGNIVVTVDSVIGAIDGVAVLVVYLSEHEKSSGVIAFFP